MTLVETTSHRRMKVDEFLVWAEKQPARYELYAGVAYLMAPEQAGHAEMKYAVQTALADGIRKAGLRCHMLPDGMTVRVGDDTAHEPDALVYCGAKIPRSALEVPNPVIVVEVASPSTRRIDASLKLAGYFGLPSVRHYLIFDPERPVVIHHERHGDAILTRVLHEGTLQLEPPGISIDFGGIIKELLPTA